MKTDALPVLPRSWRSTTPALGAIVPVETSDLFRSVHRVHSSYARVVEPKSAAARQIFAWDVSAVASLEIWRDNDYS